jgi:shikimate dehydrogenase
MLKYGLIGNSLGHSFSQKFFADFFQKKYIDATYNNIEISSVCQFLEIEGLHSYSGFNVTIPYKTEIIAYLDELSSEAQQIGAVNTIKISGNKFIGYNTDAFGFHQSIKPFLTNQHEKAIILGTGGASKAVEFVLKNLGVDVIFISNNPRAKNHFHYAEVNENMLKFCKLIINCTPVGTFPATNEKPDFQSQYLTKEHLVVDLIYNPEKTRFLLEAEKMGATILNGKQMLIQQALKSWEVWNN